MLTTKFNGTEIEIKFLKYGIESFSGLDRWIPIDDNFIENHLFNEARSDNKYFFTNFIKSFADFPHLTLFDAESNPTGNYYLGSRTNELIKSMFKSEQFINPATDKLFKHNKNFLLMRASTLKWFWMTVSGSKGDAARNYFLKIEQVAIELAARYAYLACECTLKQAETADAKYERDLTNLRSQNKRLGESLHAVELQLAKVNKINTELEFDNNSYASQLDEADEVNRVAKDKLKEALKRRVPIAGLPKQYTENLIVMRLYSDYNNKPNGEEEEPDYNIIHCQNNCISASIGRTCKHYEHAAQVKCFSNIPNSNKLLQHIRDICRNVANPVADVLGGYFTLRNGKTEDDLLKLINSAYRQRFNLNLK